jgi:DNA repair protein SbcD/Mre11
LTGPLKFIHCSDLHLGRQRLGGKLPESDLGEAFRYIVDYTLQQSAHGLLIAGDLFDTPQIQPRHLQTAIDCLRPLKEKGIPVFAIEGNHDRPSLSSELATWVRYLNDQGYLHLLSIPFTPEGPAITQWDPETRRGSYLNHHGIRIIGAGYLGAGTVRRMRAITEAFQQLDAGQNNQPTILLLHAGPEYLVHEGGGFDRESLDFLHGFADYVALGHIHKPMNYQSWAVNPGTAENIRPEETYYDQRAGTKIARGMAELIIDTSALIPQFEVSILPVPRRRVEILRFDCAPYTGKNLSEKIRAGLLEQARTLEITPQTVIRVELSGELNLQRAGLDLVELASFLETELTVLAADISLTHLNSISVSTGDGGGDGMVQSRESLERQAISQLLGGSPLDKLPEDRLPELVELLMGLKEDVRHQTRPEDILDRLARHPAVQHLTRIYRDERESPAEVQREVAVTANGGERS